MPLRTTAQALQDAAEGLRMAAAMLESASAALIEGAQRVTELVEELDDEQAG